MIRNDLLRKQLAKRPLVDRLEGRARNMRAAGDEDTAALLDDAADMLRACKGHEQWNAAVEAAAGALESAMSRGIFVGKWPDHIRSLKKGHADEG